MASSKDNKFKGAWLIALPVVLQICAILTNGLLFAKVAGFVGDAHTFSESVPMEGEIASEDQEVAEEVQMGDSRATSLFTTRESFEAKGASDDTTALNKGSWHASTEARDITLNSILDFDDKAIYNFSNMVAVGVCDENARISSTETESGFWLSVVDDNEVIVGFYNNGTEDIKPVKVTAELSPADYVDTTGTTIYVIEGYSKCADGLGIIEMTLSNDRVVSAVVLREKGKLYAANITNKPAIAENIVEFRTKMDEVLAENNIRPDNSTYLDPIYYPIVPVGAGEKTDVEYWVEKSGELVEPDWTDAHKVQAFYNYIIENLAYDHWIVGHTDANARAFYYKDFTGTYYISNTHIGVCEDFSTVLAIMCRAQGIPATKVYTGKHAWSYIYIADYGRWISVDPTHDMRNGCYSEDMTDWTTLANNDRYSCMDSIEAKYLYENLDVGIGNNVDMERYGKIPVEMQEK